MDKDSSMDYTTAGFDERLGYHKGFTALNDPAAVNQSASSATVSPRDLFMDSSCPNSNRLSDLTTPSLYDGSPEDAFDASPLFGTNDLQGAENWAPLFNDVQADNSFYGPTDQSFDSSKEASNVDSSTAMERTFSSTSSMDIKSTPSLHRMSVTSGICKTRRPGKDLPPIEVDDGDSLAKKRAKNTMAARKSRQKKRDIEDGLRIELVNMTSERDRWMHIAIANGAPLPETRSPLK